MRSIYFGTRATTGATSPTCHDFTAASDGLDLLVGLSNGEGADAAPWEVGLVDPRHAGLRMLGHPAALHIHYLQT